MAATYAQSATFRNSADAIDRVTCAVLFYARYILGEDPGTSNHSLRAAWAKNAFQNPQSVASGLLAAISLDGNIVNILPTAPTDAQLQSATETAINQILNF